MRSSVFGTLTGLVLCSLKMCFHSCRNGEGKENEKLQNKARLNTVQTWKKKKTRKKKEVEKMEKKGARETSDLEIRKWKKMGRMEGWREAEKYREKRNRTNEARKEVEMEEDGKNGEKHTGKENTETNIKVNEEGNKKRRNTGTVWCTIKEKM